MSREPKELFERGRLTDWLLGQLSGNLPSILVGDGKAPAAGGWPKGQPGQGAFVPYVVLATDTATPVAGTPLAQTVEDDWRANYTLSSFGGERNQCDWAADQARALWLTIGEQRIQIPQPWKTRQALVAQMGSVRRNDATNPPYWELADSLTITLSRCRT